MIDRSSTSLRIQATLLGLLVFLTAGCGQISRSWGDVEVPNGAPIRIGLLTDIDGVAPQPPPPETTQTVDGHPLEIVPVPVHCGGAAVAAAPDPTALGGLAGVIGASCSSACVYSESLLFEQKTTLIAAGCTAAAITQSGYGLSFRIAWNDADEGTVSADYARAVLHANTVAIISDRSAYARAMLEAYTSEFKRRGGKSVAEVDIPASGDVDVSKVIAQVESSGSEVVLFAVARPDAEGYFARFHAALPGITLIATDTVLEVPYASAAVPVQTPIGAMAAEAAAAAAAAAASDAERSDTSLIAAGIARENGNWTSEMGVDPLWSGLFATQAADALAIYERAIGEVARPARDGSLAIPRQALRDAIARLQMNGETGRIDFDGSGERRHDIGAAVYQSQDGRQIRVQVYER